MSILPTFYLLPFTYATGLSQLVGEYPSDGTASDESGDNDMHVYIYRCGFSVLSLLLSRDLSDGLVLL